MSDGDKAEVTFEVDERTLEFAHELDKSGLNATIPLIQDLLVIFTVLDEEEPTVRDELLDELQDQTSLRSTDWENILPTLSDNDWIDTASGPSAGFVLGERIVEQDSKVSSLPWG